MQALNQTSDLQTLRGQSTVPFPSLYMFFAEDLFNCTTPSYMLLGQHRLMATISDPRTLLLFTLLFSSFFHLNHCQATCTCSTDTQAMQMILPKVHEKS